MTLPQETIDKIKINAAKATNKRDEQLRERSKDYGRRLAFLDGYEEGHNAGATEWAGKAQGLVDALDKIYNGPFPINQTELEEWLLHTKRDARAALAKYKEVGNG
jgi:flagellar biosynthesis/type III secretory pathway protein FliH